MQTEIKTANYLFENQNFNRIAYLSQYNPELRKKLEPHLPRSNYLKAPSNEFVKARCVVCREDYKSFDCKEEMGKCDVCSAGEYRHLININPLELAERYKKRKHIPSNYSPSLILKIAEFFVEKYYVEKKSRHRNQIFPMIREKFEVKLDKTQLYHLTSSKYLKSLGLTHKF